MSTSNGIISIRADDTWGVICTQCHHLIKNDSEPYKPETTFRVFECDSCHNKNIIELRDIPYGKKQHKTYDMLWTSPLKEDIYHRNYADQSIEKAISKEITKYKRDKNGKA